MGLPRVCKQGWRTEDGSTQPRGFFYSRCPIRPTGLQFLLLAILLRVVNSAEMTAKVLNLDVPAIVDPRTEKVVLRCEYNLKKEELYYVTWHKNGIPFFRYMPSSNPPGCDFKEKGIVVDVDASDRNQVVLRASSYFTKDTTSNFAGAYGCEISSEGPEFVTDYAEANMSVAILPKGPPILTGMRPYYKVDDVMDVVCRSLPGYPPASLSFFLNDEKVNATHAKPLLSEGDTDTTIVSTTTLRLRLRLQRQHFPGGTLSLICRSTLPGIQAAKALNAEGTATLAASNQRLAQEPPKSGSTSGFPVRLDLIWLMLLLERYRLSSP